tara:strand:- start:248 stop:475 length:228 start_codon:yes stop_codon:yes gene_type:complete
MTTADDIRASYKAIFESNDGKVVMDDLAKRFHVASPVFSEDPYETAFRDGQRTVVLFLNQQCQDRKAQEKQTVGE